MVDVILLVASLTLFATCWWAFRRAVASEDPMARFWSFEIPAVGGSVLVLLAKVLGLESSVSVVVVYLCASVLTFVSFRRIWRFIKWQFANPRRSASLTDPPL
jgi:hypothetical protein